MLAQLDRINTFVVGEEPDSATKAKIDQYGIKKQKVKHKNWIIYSVLGLTVFQLLAVNFVIIMIGFKKLEMVHVLFEMYLGGTMLQIFLLFRQIVRHYFGEYNTD